MTLNQLFKVPENTYFKSIPDHYFLHSKIALDLACRKRYNLDCSKPIPPQLNIKEITLRSEYNNIVKTYSENIKNQKSWIIHNKHKNLKCRILHVPDSNDSIITKITLTKCSLYNQDIFYKIIHGNLTLWKKTIWKKTYPSETPWKHKEIYSCGAVMERNAGHQQFTLTHTGGSSNAQEQISIFNQYYLI